MRGIFRAAVLAAAVIGCGFAGCATGGGAGVGNGVGLRMEGTGEVGRKLFDEGWLFEKGDVKGGEGVGLDDKGWRQVELPHDWSIEGPFDRKWASCTGFLPGGIGWYRKHFRVEDIGGRLKDDEMVRVEFEGVYKHATVYLNGHKVGGRAYGYSTFECDLTPWLRRDGGENVLAVRVDHHDFADSRWYPGSGIYRDVYLVRSGRVHVGADGTAVTTPVVNEKGATVEVATQVVYDARPEAGAPRHVQLRTKVFDPTGRVVAQEKARASVPAGGKVTWKERLQVQSPQRWSIEKPALYTAVTEVMEKGRVVDRYQTSFGIRTINFDANTGFWLNGENVKMRGVCLHEDAGALGSAIPRQVWERRLSYLKAAGVNAIRTSHNPPAPEFLDLCDRMGFVVMDEAFDEWTRGKKKWVDRRNGQKYTTDGYHSDFAQWADRDIQDMVRRDRNHPSVVMWSIGNEIDYPNDAYPPNSPELPPIASRLIADVKAVDRTRPVTAACAAIATNLFFPQLDIVGYNYQEKRYAEDHAKNPLRVIYGSENSQSLEAWRAVEKNPYIFGQFLWTGEDYLGEAGRWPVHGSGAGLLDLAGYPKGLYWFRKSLWVSAPFVAVDRGWRGEMACYTNCDHVEFLQGGKSLGELERPMTTGWIRVPAFDRELPLQIVGKRDGKQVAQETFLGDVKATRIGMTAYKSTLGPGDGPNVAQIEVALTNDDGATSWEAGNDVSFEISGPGRLLGIESGDLTSLEDPHAPHRKAYHGRLIVYVETHGVVTVKARAGGLKGVEIEVGKE